MDDKLINIVQIKITKLSLMKDKNIVFLHWKYVNKSTQGFNLQLKDCAYETLETSKI